METMLIFPLPNTTPTTDHCTECGGEEYEGDCGRLKTFLALTMRHGNCIEYREKAICEFCAMMIEGYTS